MTPNEYQRLAARTLIDKPDFTIPDTHIMLVWNAIGLAGECGEVAEVVLGKSEGAEFKAKLRKELSDASWYTAAICTKINIPLLRIMPEGFTGDERDLTRLSLRLCADAGNVTEHIKKGVFHQHGVDIEKLEILLRLVVMSVVNVCEVGGIDLEQGWIENIEKLKKRYPNGYSAKDSINRVESVVV